MGGTSAAGGLADRGLADRGGGSIAAGEGCAERSVEAGGSGGSGALSTLGRGPTCTKRRLGIAGAPAACASTLVARPALPAPSPGAAEAPQERTLTEPEPTASGLMLSAWTEPTAETGVPNAPPAASCEPSVKRCTPVGCSRASDAARSRRMLQPPLSSSLQSGPSSGSSSPRLSVAAVPVGSPAGRAPSEASLRSQSQMRGTRKAVESSCSAAVMANVKL